MALIGRNTVTGNFIKCSNLTPDGSTTTFTLTNSTTGDNVYPGNQNSLIVSVSGVIQNPGTAYTINNNQITFSTAPSISDTIDFIVIMGDLVAIGTPSDDTVDTVHIKNGAVHNTKLQHSAITINGTSISLGASGDIVAGTDWQSVVVADGSTGLTASAGRGYFIDTTSGTQTVTLPNDASSTIGDTIIIRDYAGTFNTNNVTITSTAKISGADADGTLATNDLVVTLVYVDSTKGWVTIENEAKTIGAEDPAYISATGGTVTESGDYKIHTFTGDGCFVVSNTGNPAGGGSAVDYMVVAGGGAARDGGAGAGGFRESKDSTLSSPHTASPLAATTGLTVTTTTYPVSIGAGGADSATDSARNGTPSSFSTITSAGGGYGRSSNSGDPGGPGGSGGANRGGPGGTGNTPPVSPPQGQPGGNSTGPATGVGGGGGATAAGGNFPGPRLGGTGATTSISGSPVGYSGGGAGAAPEIGDNLPRTPCGSGGAGISGAQGAPGPQCGVANRGGGGGGVWCGTNGAGGSGIVIIRYKFQN